MRLKKLTIFEFDEFSYNHPLGSYHQTSNYAMLAAELGYDYDLIGMVDENDNIVAASLILIKKVNMFTRYGYAPKGFLIDYYNYSYLSEFTELLKKYYHKQNIAFIKINPEIAIGIVDKNEIINNDNLNIEKNLENLGYRKLIDNKKLFANKLPIFNSVVLLKDTSLKTISKHTRNKINKTLKNELVFEKGSREDIETIYRFIKRKKDKSINHYYNYFNAFSKNDSMDIFLVKIDFEKCLINLKKRYEDENTRNAILVGEMMKNCSNDIINKKLQSDATLNLYKNNITKLTKYLSIKKEEYIAGAITIKYNNRVNILISGYDKKYKDFNANYFLHYKLMEYYKNDFDFLDLNGITGNFDKNNPYKGLNDFKLGFNPHSFELIGEFDLIINDGLYKAMERKGFLAKEFNRKQKELIDLIDD